MIKGNLFLKIYWKDAILFVCILANTQWCFGFIPGTALSNNSLKNMWDDMRFVGGNPCQPCARQEPYALVLLLGFPKMPAAAVPDIKSSCISSLLVNKETTENF